MTWYLLFIELFCAKKLLIHIRFSTENSIIWMIDKARNSLYNINNLIKRQER